MEQRLRTIGKTAAGRAIFVVFTLRNRGGHIFIRPISARYMHGKEVKSYEKENVTAQVRIGRSRGPQGGEPAFGVLAQGLDDVPALLFGGRYECCLLYTSDA